MRRFGAWIAMTMGMAACLEPSVDGPSDAGLAALVAPHAPCINQEGGVVAADCQAIDIVEATIPLVAGGDATATVQPLGATPTLLVSATISGPPSFTFTDAACAGLQSCTFTPNQGLPYQLGVACSTATATPAQLQVQGTNGAMDTDIAGLTCAPPGPTISVTPSTIATLVTPVGTPIIAPQQITVTNDGTSTLDYTVSNFDPTQWQLVNVTCAGFPNCSLPGNGASHTFDVQFTPTTHHMTPITNTFTFDGGTAGMPTVQVSGTGTGAVMAVMPTSHDFLQLARGALGTQTITVTNMGNEPLNVSMSPPIAPFGSSATSLTVMPGGSSTFEATCQSATALPTTSGSILLMSDAYLPVGGMQNIELKCEVLATDLQVMPNPVPFDEVRKGSPARSIDVTLMNASSATETVTSIALVGNPSALSKSGFSSGQIAGGTSRTVTLELATGNVVDLAGSKLEIQLAGQPTPLAVPIQGKVVVPSARVMPEALDLGTACIGSSVTGTVTMVNDGTATLTVAQPTMDTPFVAVSSSTFPVSLAANGEVGVSVSPASMVTVGNAKGVLTWAVRALGEPFETFTVPVDLTYIPSGTAVSPAKLDFGELDVMLISSPSTVTLRNCDPNPVIVRVEGLSAERGPLDVWQIEPSTLERTLASQETLTIAARFAPKRSGRHSANIVIRVDGEQRLVNLTGNALGQTVDKASLYACDCSSSKPWAAWPIGLVVVFVLRRRSTARGGRRARSS